MSSGGVVLNTMSGSYNVKNPAFGGDDSSRYEPSQIVTNGNGHPFGAKASFSDEKTCWSLDVNISHYAPLRRRYPNPGKPDDVLPGISGPETVVYRDDEPIPGRVDTTHRARAKKFLQQVNPKNTKKKNSTGDENNELYDPQNFMQTIRVLGGCDERFNDWQLNKEERRNHFYHAIYHAKATLGELEELATPHNPMKGMPPCSASGVMDGRGKFNKPKTRVYGCLDFNDNVNQAPYVVLDHKQPNVYGDLVKFMLTKMGIRPPRLIISVIGEFDDVAKHEKLKTVLKNGLEEAPDAWVITDGLNKGTGKVLGDLMDDIRQSQLPRDDKAFPVIGIMPWQDVLGRERQIGGTFRARDSKHDKMIGSGVYHEYSSREPWNLDRNHTFFVFVDDPENDFNDVAFRRSFVSYVRKLPFSQLKEYRNDYNAIKSPKPKQTGDQQLEGGGKEFDDANQNDHFVELTTQIGSMDIVVGGGKEERHLLLCEGAVTKEHASPLLVIEGSGGLADLLSYAYRQQHSLNPSSVNLNSSVLESDIRQMYEIFGGKHVSTQHKRINNVVTVERKIVNHCLRDSDGEDLDQAMLQALIKNMQSSIEYNKQQRFKNDVTTLQGGKPIKPHLAKQVEKYPALIDQAQTINSRYQLHLNILRYAMGFDRRAEAEVELVKLEKLWSSLIDRLRRLCNTYQAMEDALDSPPHRVQTADEMSERELYQWGMSKILYHTANFRGVADSGGSSGTRKTKKKSTMRKANSASGWELARNSAVLAQEVKMKRLGRLGVQGFEFESTVGMGEMNPAKKTTAGFDHTVHQTFEDQLQLALEWALTTDKVDLVDMLIPAVAEPKDDDLRGGVAEFLYGQKPSRPGEGYGTTLAELYEYEHGQSNAKLYLKEILRFSQDKLLNPKVDEPFYRDLDKQIKNNLRVRRVWAMILQFLMKNTSMKAPTWHPTTPWLPWHSAPDYETDPLLHIDPKTAGKLVSGRAKVQITEVPAYKKAPNGIDLQYHPDTKQLASQIMQSPTTFKGLFSGIGLAQKDLAGGIPIRVVKNKFGDEIEVPLEFSKDGKLVLVQKAKLQGAFDKDGYLRLKHTNAHFSMKENIKFVKPIHDIRKMDGADLDGVLDKDLKIKKIIKRLQKDRTLESVFFLLFDPDPDDEGFMGQKSFPDRENHAYQELMLWAVVMNRPQLAEYFWEKGGHSIPNALIASAVAEGIAGHPKVRSKGKLTKLMDEMRAMSAAFENRAIDVMRECYDQSQTQAQNVIETTLEAYDWLNQANDSLDSLELAELAENKEFISEPACQAVIERNWAGSKSLMQASERERYGKQLKWNKLFYNKLFSPKWKYRFEVLSYTALILLFVVVSIWPIKIELSYPELLLSLFMIALVFDEVRQLLAPILFEDRKLTNQLWEHVSDGWNNIDLALFIVYGFALGIRMTTGPDAYEAPWMENYQSRYGIKQSLRTSKGLYGICTMLSIVKSLRYTMVFRILGPRIIIMQKLTSDAVQYISLLLLFAAAYGVYVQSVLNPFYPINTANDVFGAFMRILYKPYFQSYGELMLDDLHDETSCIGSRAKFTDCDSWLDVTIPLVTGIYLVISSIMIINMLIADFTRTFETIYDEADQWWRMEYYKLYVEQKHRSVWPAPFSLAANLWVIARALFKSAFNLGEEKEEDADQSLAEKDSRIATEAFQERCTSEYFLREQQIHTDTHQVDGIQKTLEDALHTIEFFKARSISQSFKHELSNDSENHVVTAFGDGENLSTGYGSFLATQLDLIARKCKPPILKPPSRKYISEASVKFVSYEQVDGYPGHFRRKASDDDDDDDGGGDDVASQTQLSIQQVRIGEGNGKKAFERVFQELTHDYSQEDLMRIVTFETGAPADRSIDDVRLSVWRSAQMRLWENSVCSFAAAGEGVGQDAWTLGANHKVFHLVTRWKRDSNNIRMDRLSKPLLEFIAVKRDASGTYWSIPEISKLLYESKRHEMNMLGTNTDEGRAQVVSKPCSPVMIHALHKRNFREHITFQQQNLILQELTAFFDTERPDATATPKDSSLHEEDPPMFPMFNQKLDDPRNTGLAWLEADIHWFHEPLEGNLFNAFDLRFPGDSKDAGLGEVDEIAWLTIHKTMDLSGDQEDLLKQVARILKASW